MLRYVTLPDPTGLMLIDHARRPISSSPICLRMLLNKLSGCSSPSTAQSARCVSNVVAREIIVLIFLPRLKSCGRGRTPALAQMRLLLVEPKTRGSVASLPSCAARMQNMLYENWMVSRGAGACFV
jgi:hypothetical protein